MSKNKTSPSNLGAVVSIRGSVEDIWFDAHVPPIYSLLHAKEGEIAIEVLAHFDAHRVRGIALTPTQGLARGMAVVALILSLAGLYLGLDRRLTLL